MRLSRCGAFCAKTGLRATGAPDPESQSCYPAQPELATTPAHSPVRCRWELCEGTPTPSEVAFSFSRPVIPFQAARITGPGCASYNPPTRAGPEPDLLEYVGPSPMPTRTS